MTPRYRKTSTPRYKPKQKLPRRAKIRPAEPAVLDAFYELQANWSWQEKPHILAPGASPLTLHRKEREAWRDLMRALMVSQVPRGS
ncbi:hypothetical protein [Bradyrhizobium sp. NBAIM16]|uniref:hypothetical protein n=1 Tax=Bradyrhizobium sp. NBAIM16 TaxID=2793813 RepID=UPI001CD5C991|nr:hypothetical protein [Bradyrhizobium sp. NBAIM16]